MYDRGFLYTAGRISLAGARREARAGIPDLGIVETARFTLTPKPPYSFGFTAGHLTYFQGRYGADRFEDGAFSRLLEIDGKLALLRVSSSGTVDAPRLELIIAADRLDEAAVAESRRQAEWMLGIEQDLSAFYAMARDDQQLAPVVELMHGLHIPRTATTYEALILAILGQQISIHVARMLRTLLIETYGRSMEHAGATYCAFPAPEALCAAGVDGLRKIKFSGRKAEYVVDIASKVASGELDLDGLRRRSGEEIVERLTALRGIGPWTAHWLMIRSLGQTDGVPDGDLALQRTLGFLANGGRRMSAEEALAHSQRWCPYRSYAVTYLFAGVRSGQLSLEGVAQVGP